MVGRWKISSPGRSDAWSRKDGIALGGVLLVVAGLALALAWPWLPRPAPGGPTLARYAPIRDGEATLLARYDAGDELQGWESRNAAFVPAAAIYNDLRGAFASAILQFYRRPGEASFPIAELTTRLAPVQIRESRSRELPVRGRAKSSSDVLLREARRAAGWPLRCH